MVYLRGRQPRWASSGAYGTGYAYGFAYGNGYGDLGERSNGDGCGRSDQEAAMYWRACIATYASLWTARQRARLQAARDAGAVIAYWRSDWDGRPCNGGHGRAVAVGRTQKVKGPLALCESGTLHAALRPDKWCGIRMWIVALHGEVVGDETKYGSLCREILGECLSPKKRATAQGV